MITEYKENTYNYLNRIQYILEYILLYFFYIVQLDLEKSQRCRRLQDNSIAIIYKWSSHCSSLKQKYHHKDSLIIIGGVGGCHTDSLQHPYDDKTVMWWRIYFSSYTTKEIHKKKLT